MFIGDSEIFDFFLFGRVLWRMFFSFLFFFDFLELKEVEFWFLFCFGKFCDFFGDGFLILFIILDFFLMGSLVDFVIE